MLRKLFGVAVLAAWLGRPILVSAQGIPMPVGATRLPDPIPLQTMPKDPGYVQGPISPEAAPPGPPEELDLPASHTSAFQAEEYAVHDHVFLHLGSLFLQRQQLGHQPYVYFDSSRDPNAVEFNQLPRRSQNIVPVLDPGNIRPTANFGVLATVGYLGQNCAFEVNGFYIPEHSDTISTSGERALNAFFTAPPELARLAGILTRDNNGVTETVVNNLFLQGDLAAMTLTTSLGSIDANYRYFSKSATGIEPLLGVRYVNYRERFAFRFDDNGISSQNAIGQSDVTTAVNVNSRVVNNFVGPQFGVENQLTVIHGVTLGLSLKSAVGANFADFSYEVANGDNSFSRLNHRTRTNFSSVHEVNAFLDVYYLERMRLRAGYRALFLLNFPEAVDQINFDLSQPNGRTDNSGNIFFHGASIELQFLF